MELDEYLIGESTREGEGGSSPLGAKCSATVLLAQVQEVCE